MKPAADSKANRRRNLGLRLLAAAIVIVTVAAGLYAMGRGGRQSTAESFGSFVTVRPTSLDVTFVKDGELQALTNIEVISEVEGSTAIQTIVREGASVRAGDELLTLDSAGIRTKIEETTLELQKAEADLTTSVEIRAIQVSQNSANIEAAEVALTLARLDYEQYMKGTYPQELKSRQTAVEMAEITLANRQEELGQVRALFDRAFVTATEVKQAELNQTNALNALNEAKTALDVLTTYRHAMVEAEKRNAVSQADQRLVRAQREARSNMAQRDADVSAKEQRITVLRDRLQRLNQQLEACTIRAPADGLVVYASTADRNSQTQIQEGAMIRERQVILRLPDTSSMKAVIRVQEAQVPRLREGQRATVRIVGANETIGGTIAKISVLADSGQRWWNPDLKEYPVDVVLDETPPGLKPGVGCEVRVFVDHADDVLVVPLAAIYTVGADRFVFVRGGQGVQPQRVALGRTNDTHAEVREGLIADQEVLVLQVGQGQRLLEQAGVEVTPREPNRQRPGSIAAGNGERPRRPAGEARPGPAPAADSAANGAAVTAQAEPSAAAAPAEAAASETPKPAEKATAPTGK